MKISIAHALKEKNRLAKEIERLWEVFQSENSSLETHKRTADVRKTLQTIEAYTAKLVEVKTKVGNASTAAHCRNIHLLDETKNKMAKLASTNGSTDAEKVGFSEVIVHTAIFDEAMLIQMRHQLQYEANQLQDKIDEFNAVTEIEFVSPLN